MATNPMHQFEVHKIGPSLSINGIDISFTNSSLFMMISSILIITFFVLGTKKISIVPGKIQILNELVFNFISKMINETVGNDAKPYFPFILTLFIFILTMNMIGLLPYSFTVTSQVIVTFFFAIVIFIGVTIVGFAKNGLGFLKIFVPSGIPVFLLPLLVVIEIISFLSRPISLFVVSLGILGGWLPLTFSVALTALEILVAFLQAYVFAVLSCIYLNDALHMHH